MSSAECRTKNKISTVLLEKSGLLTNSCQYLWRRIPNANLNRSGSQ